MNKFILNSLWWLVSLPFKLVFLTLIWIFSGSGRHTSDGYIVKKSSLGKDQYEHRLIAEEVLERRLLPGEVVHHINGRRDDNRPSNLCVMPRVDHDRYHAWYDWIHKTYGRYPRRETQLRKLRESFNGTLLEEVARSGRLIG